MVAKRAVVVAVAGRAFGDDGAVLDGEGFRRPGDLPAGEVAAVEQGSESSLDDRPGDLRDSDDDQWKETGDDIHDFPGQRSDSVLAVSRYFSILATTSGF